MKYMYTNGKYHAPSVNNVSTMMQAMNYGTAAFEGMKAFYVEDRKGWFLFRPEKYYQRLCRSAGMIGLDFKLSFEEFVGIISRLIRKNNVRADTYIRPLVYREEKGVGLMRPSTYGVSIFIQSIPFSSANQFRCCFVSQKRPTDGTYSGKLTGNYLLSFFSAQEAKDKGYDVGILSSTEGHAAEASIMNLFFVKDGKLFTPALDCGPLAGITRLSIIQLTKEMLKMKVTEGKYRREKLLEADEIFFTGTGSGVNYVKQLERRKFNLERKGQIAPQLAAIFEDVVRLRNDCYQDWLVKV